MNRNQIKGALLALDYQLKDVAEGYGCRPDFVSSVIAGTEQSVGVQAYIAGILRLPLAEVWE